ncbi:MAG TPA: hypothetical protein VJ965_08735 [Anaerolineales bacterium]|nr:hypothetical protein [Anaerolineales bacterium]
MTLYNSKLIARLVTILGWLIIIGILLLILFFIGYFNEIPAMYPFGTANDVTGSIEAVLIAVLATILIPAPKKKPVWFGVFLLLAIVSWIGAAIISIDLLDAGNIISATTRSILRRQGGFIGFISWQTLHYGIGLQGLWFMGVNLFALLENIWPRKVTIMGIATGLLFASGLIDGLEINPLGSILEIFWCFWLAREINPQEATPVESFSA